MIDAVGDSDAQYFAPPIPCDDVGLNLALEPQYAPAFVSWLKQQTGVEVVAAPADPEKAVRDRKEDVVLIIEKDFSKNMGRAIPAAVKVVNDSSRESAERKVKRVRTLIRYLLRSDGHVEVDRARRGSIAGDAGAGGGRGGFERRRSAWPRC